MVLYLTFLTLVISQLLLARGLGGRMPRILMWVGVVTSLFVMHFVAINETGFLRMILLCNVLLAGMKWVVYREWTLDTGKKLSWCRWWMFSALWFGMEPSCFVGKCREVEWRSHAVVGALCVLGGILGVWLCCVWQVENIVILFVAISMGFHFGMLRLLTAFWRMLGFPVRTLFRNPLVMKGFRDFWGMRWNLAYSQMMARAVKKPLTPIVGEKWSVFAVFVASGLLHELAITVPVQGGYGWPTLFFVINGIITVFEKEKSWRMGLCCGILLVMGLPYLFGEKFVEEIIIPSRDVFEYLTL